MSKRLFATLLGVSVIALVAGCGSSGGGDTTGGSDTTGGASAPSLSKAEFIKQGDEICRKGYATIEREASEFARENGANEQQPTKAETEEMIAQVYAPALKRQAEEIGALGAPSGDEAQVEAIVAAVGRGASQLEEDPGALLAGKNPLKEASSLARAYGFKKCGEE